MATKPKSPFAKLMLATLAGTLALSGTVATVVHAETNADDFNIVQALDSAKLTLADAIRTAQTAGTGMVTVAEFTIGDGKPLFDVTTQNGSIEIDHLIDPATGAIMASSLDAENADGDSDAEAAELAAPQGAKVSLLQAITVAEAQGGKAMSAEYGQDGSVLAIEVEIADASGKTVEMKVDATTGIVMAADGYAGDEDSENGEDGEGSEEQEG